MSLTWYSWLEMGRDVKAAPATLAAIGRALELDRDETSYLLALADSAHVGLPLGQTGDIDETTLAELVDGFRDGPAFVVDRRWNVVASNEPARSLYGFAPSNSVDQNVVWRLLHDSALRSLHADPDDMVDSIAGFIRYNYADDPESIELTQFLSALAGDQRFQRAWKRYSVGIFSPMTVAVRQNGTERRFRFVALSIGHRGRETLVIHLPLR